MTEKRQLKQKIPLWLYPDEIRKLDSNVLASSASSRNQYVSNAIDFYSGYLQSTYKNEFLPLALETSLQGIVDKSESHLSKLIFKLTVELGMTMNILASTVEIEESTLKKLRAKCIEDAKKTVGRISLEEIVRYQNKQE